MRSGAKQRVSIAGAVAACSIALIALLLASGSPATAGAGGSGPALNPDLIVEPPSELILQRGGRLEAPRAQGKAPKPVYLRFSHTTSNGGKGPLEIYPDTEDESCGDAGNRGRTAFQRVYEDTNSNGVFDRTSTDGTTYTDKAVGCMTFHAVHDHYHFEDFARYELYRVSSGKLKETSDKVSFCVADLNQPYPGLPGSPANIFYKFENCKEAKGIHGISVGWSDVYSAGTPGQEFDVTDRRPGRYCLVAYTDPVNRLTELSPGGEDNNVQTVQLKVNVNRATRSGIEIEPMSEPCSPPPGG